MDINEIPTQWKSQRQRIVDYVEALINQIMMSPSKELLKGDTLITEENGNTTNNTVPNIEDYQMEVNQILEDPGRNFNANSQFRAKKFVSWNYFHCNHLLIIDDNMYYRSMRYEYYKLAKKYKLSFGIIFFDIGMEQCLKNNISRSENISNKNIVKIIEGIPNHIEDKNTPSKISSEAPFHLVTNEMIMDMNSKLEPPAQEGFEKQKFIIINHVNDTSVSQVKSFIEEAFNKPINVPVDETPRQESAENFIQTCDLCLRKIVSSHIKNYMKTNITQTTMKTFSTLDFAKSYQSSPVKEFAQRMANIKKVIMKDIHNGNVALSAENDQLELMKILTKSFEACMIE